MTWYYTAWASQSSYNLPLETLASNQRGGSVLHTALSFHCVPRESMEVLHTTPAGRTTPNVTSPPHAFPPLPPLAFPFLPYSALPCSALTLSCPTLLSPPPHACTRRPLTLMNGQTACQPHTLANYITEFTLKTVPSTEVRLRAGLSIASQYPPHFELDCTYSRASE